MDPKNDNPLHSILPANNRKVISPLPGQSAAGDENQAAELIRRKIQDLYNKEPNAKEELAEAEAAGKDRSKHQEFMHELSGSGRSLAEIQTAWHNYYLNLPDDEKHQVWQEFYAEHSKHQTRTHQPTHHTAAPDPKPVAIPLARSQVTKKHQDPRSVADIKRQLTGRVQKRTKLKAKDHAHSVLFGLGMGAIVVVIMLFSFFNERFIAPFITPSRAVSNTPLIIDPSSTGVGKDPKIIIPKINVEIPVIYNEPSIDEGAVQRALEGGVLHYATTPNPGETGNGVIFGHSSNNILNGGKYKFAFVLLKRLENGDTFMIEKDGKRYVYRVFDKKIVPPTDLSVLGKTDKPSTFTLITCDPPGTSINRLVVIGEQISPDPANNVASKVDQNAVAKPQELPSNSETLWSRFYGWLNS